jgi:hypothetical protein
MLLKVLIRLALEKLREMARLTYNIPSTTVSHLRYRRHCTTSQGSFPPCMTPAIFPPLLKLEHPSWRGGEGHDPPRVSLAQSTPHGRCLLVPSHPFPLVVSWRVSWAYRTAMVALLCWRQ